jgi:peroxiredoxin
VAFFNWLAKFIGVEASLTNILAGNIAPAFSLKALDGKTYSLNSLLEKGPVVVAFFKISCPVCQFTFPFLQRLAERYAGDGVTFLGISQDNAKSTKEFNQEFGVKFPVLLDEENYPVSNAYGLTSVPTIFLIAPSGKVNVSCMGFSKSDLEEIANSLAERRKLPPAPVFRADEAVPAFKPG